MASTTTLESPDLSVFLQACAADDVNALANKIVEAFNGRRGLSVSHVSRSIETRKLTGHLLISDIIADLSTLGSHSLGPSLDYQKCVVWIAGRHNIEVSSSEPIWELERQIFLKYDLDHFVKSSYKAFKDKGGVSIPRKIFWMLPIGTLDGLLAADWKAVTYIVLQIATMRVLNRARNLWQVVES